MSRLQDLSCTFAYDDAGGHGVAGCYTGQDGAVSNAKFFHTINLEIAIYYRHGVAPHLGTACLVQTGLRRLANEIFQLLRLQIAWQNLALNKGAKWHRVAYFPAKLYTCHGTLEISQGCWHGGARQFTWPKPYKSRSSEKVSAAMAS
jgi:hypothetical protein